MPLSASNIMRGSLAALAPAALALAASAAISISGAQAQDRDSGIYFTAELAAPQSEARIVAGGVVWLCQDTSCKAQRSTARPLRICSALAREVGEIRSFVVEGEAMDEDRLARCNR